MSNVYEPIILLIIEITSAAICMILVRFMIKPYLVTREARYIGLPLGFGFLGASYILSAIAYAPTNLLVSNCFSDNALKWVQLIVRAFSFAFIAASYYFSKKPSKNTRLIWDIILTVLMVAVIFASLLVVIFPQFTLRTYQTANALYRVFNLICLTYICFHCIREHVKDPYPLTILVPFGYVFLAVGQYSLFISTIEGGKFAFWASFPARLIGLAIFLFVAERTFHHSKKKGSIK